MPQKLAAWGGCGWGEGSVTYTVSLRANAAQSIKSYIINLHIHQRKGRLEGCETGMMEDNERI